MRSSSTFNDVRDTVVFVRIPKTGSTTFATMFQTAVGPDRWARLEDRRIDTWDMGLQLVHDHLRRFGMRLEGDNKRVAGNLAGRRAPHAEAIFLHGHHPLWAPLPTRRRAHFVSLFRDPVDRFLSQYFCIRGKAEARPGGGSGEKRRVLDMAPDDYVDWLLASSAQPQRSPGSVALIEASAHAARVHVEIPLLLLDLRVEFTA